MQKNEHHGVPVVPLYGSHVAPERENESCIDEASGEARELHFLFVWRLQTYPTCFISECGWKKTVGGVGGVGGLGLGHSVLLRNKPDERFFFQRSRREQAAAAPTTTSR